MDRIRRLAVREAAAVRKFAPEIRDMSEDAGWLEGLLIAEFHADRCAMCGKRVADNAVTDHDHATGLVRGFLCRGCNTREGMCGAPVFVKYRRRYPMLILGIEWAYSP